MDIFKMIEEMGHEQVVFCHDDVSGLRAIIAIHDTTLGPALGGTRMWNYDTEAEALRDALRLSRGMTYKNSAMGLNLGGGKAVIIGDPRKDKSEALFRAFGKFVESLQGRYVTAEDVSIGTEDCVIMSYETSHVVGLPGRSGNPSPATAFGVFRGMQAAILEKLKTESFEGLTVALQGIGSVGYSLAGHLHEAGANLVVTDIFPEKVQRAVDNYGARAVEPDDIYAVDCDIFAPCALGAIINDDTIPQLKAQIIAGAANNQLATPEHGDRLHELGILYVPDYVINGGGVINVSEEYHPNGYDHDRAYAKVTAIYDKVQRVFEISRERGIPTYQAADIMAEERITQVRELHRIYIP